MQVPAEASLTAGLGLGAHVAPCLRLDWCRLGIQGIQVQLEALVLPCWRDPVPEIVLSVTDIKEQRKGSSMIRAPQCSFVGVIKNHLHFEVKRVSIDGVLRGVMESNLSNVPHDLRTADERFCSVIQAQVSIRCIYAVDIVFETIVFISNIGILPGGEE